MTPLLAWTAWTAYSPKGFLHKNHDSNAVVFILQRVSCLLASCSLPCLLLLACLPARFTPIVLSKQAGRLPACINTRAIGVAGRSFCGC